MKTLIEIIKEHITYRKQIGKLALANLVKTYRGSALGWAWAFVRPVVTIFVFWFAFSFGLRAGGDVDGFPFFLWLIAGFIPWFYMSEMISGGAGCIRSNKFMVTKMKFPISIIPTFVSLSKFSVHLILMVVMIGIFIVFGYFPDVYYLQLPIYMLMMLMFFTVWGLFAGMLSAISKDFLNLVKSVRQAIFWLSGIIYNVQNIDIPWIRAILSYNPVTIVATGYRHCFIDKTWFFEDLGSIRNFFIVYIIMIIGAIWAYKRLYKDIPDVM
ncbi:MAG: ABC transporter permease [Firmicutes bacterium]|nr:ABC transporter permease [Bacillota bacterium]MBQ3611201.1 ABC transporter permease [Bacillota bacterium]MBQ4595452.1 ABC transporter permease [Bacillota bacterium]